MALSRPARIVLAALGVVVALVAVVAIVLRQKGNDILQAGAQHWASDKLAAVSDSVYTLTISNLRFEPVSSAIRFDSVRVMTDTARNARLPRPRPAITLLMRGGRVSGINFRELIGNQAIQVDELGFDGVTADVAIPPADTTPKTGGGSPAPRPSQILAIGERAPAQAEGTPLVRVRRVSLPGITVHLVLADSGRHRVDVEDVGITLDSVSFDSRSTAVSTPFYVRDIAVVVASFKGKLDDLTSIEFTDLAGSFADSSLTLAKIRWGPTGSDEEFFKAHKYRATRAIIAADQFEADGIDWAGMLLNDAITIRRGVVDGLLVDLLSDKRWPSNPVKSVKPSPQQRAAKLNRRLAIDSVVIRGGKVRYGERPAAAPTPGILTFDDLEAAITNFTNDPSRQTDSTPARLAAKGKFMNAGALQAVIEFPLLADNYQARYRASIGPMPVAALNRMIQPLTGVEAKSGDFTSVRLTVSVRNGVYSGMVIPEFQGLGVTFPASAQEKAKEKGVGGLFKKAKRGAMGVAANTVVETNNPQKAGKPPKTGKISYVRKPTETFWAGIWQSLKPALFDVLGNIKL